MNEVTDDKSLPKRERKELQIKNSPKKSKEAKLVKLADKLDNLSSFFTCVPKGWDWKRVQGYFIWAFKVIEGMRGTNVFLEEELDLLSRKWLTMKTMEFKVLPEGDTTELLNRYLDSMSTCAD